VPAFKTPLPQVLAVHQAGQLNALKLFKFFK